MTPPIESPACRDALDWLQRRLDGGSAPMPESVTIHVRQCSDCRSRIRAAERLIQVLADKPSLRQLSSERIVLAVQRDQRRQQIGRWVATATALAAALMLGVWLVTRPIVGPNLPEMVQASSLREDAAVATDAILAASKRAAVESFGESQLLLPKVELPPIASTALASAAAPIQDAGKGFLSGLEPVSSSARRALGMFLKDGGNKNN